MSESAPGTVAFVLYILLFGWIGYRRGMFRELSVLVVSVGGFFLLEQNPGPAMAIVRQALGLVLSIINIGARLLASLRAGGAESGDPVFTLTASDWISESDEPTVAFLVWSGLLLLTYILTNKAIPDSRSASGLLAALLGVINGLFYIPTFVPRLVAFVPEISAESASLPGTGEQQILRSLTEMLQSNFGNIWNTFEPQQPILAAIVLTLLLVAVISTLRRGQS
jgi:hypothetical protein